MAPLRHGGRLAWARRAFPDAPAPWLDLSTGINPRPWPGRRAPSGDLRRLPDPEDVARLEGLAADAFGARPQAVAACPGAEAALRLLPSLTGARRVAIAAPTYGGHAEAWAAAGAEVSLVKRDRLAEADAGAVVLVNPNNPDGSATSLVEVLDAAARLAARGAWLIVDESFVEVRPELSVARFADGRLVVLRSFGKFYGLPGARLGFLVGDARLAAAMRARLGDWPLGADALALGLGAYADAAWAARARADLRRDAARLDRLLERGGLPPLGGTDLFRLVRAPRAERRFAALAARGILTRPFTFDPDVLRFGLPGPGDWRRLGAALEACNHEP